MPPLNLKDTVQYSTVQHKTIKYSSAVLMPSFPVATAPSCRRAVVAALAPKLLERGHGSLLDRLLNTVRGQQLWPFVAVHVQRNFDHLCAPSPNTKHPAILIHYAYM